MAITSLDTKTANLLQKEMTEALQGIALKHGVKITAAGGTINPNHVDVFLKFRVEVSDIGAKDTARKQEFDQYCELFGMKPEHFGATFTSRGQTYKISGLELRRRKFPIRAVEIASGKELLFTEEVAKRLSPVAA